MDDQIYTVRLPDIGEGVVEGEVVEWLKNVGDTVKRDEPVVVVMTDKATVELPSPYPGTLVKQYVAIGHIAIKDKPLYDIAGQDLQEKRIEKKEESPEIKQPQESKPAVCQEALASTPCQALASTPCNTNKQEGSAVLATPKVRGLAKELGIPLHEVKGTGQEGRITLEDLKGWAAQSEKKSPPAILHLEDDEEVPLMGIRGLMAKKMAEAHAHIPQFSYFEQVDATHLIQLRTNFKQLAAQEGIPLSYMPFFLKALSLTMKAFPLINSCIDVERSAIVMHKPHNIAIAMASSQGLVVPVLRNVESMSLEEVIKAYEALKVKAASGKLTSADMKDATITLTNFGAFEGSGTWATPMINYPQVAILGMARIRKEPVVRNDEIVIRDMLPLSWSFDHRIIDGELAIAVSHFYHNLIRDPAQLL